jgi:hypothetical protein
MVIQQQQVVREQHTERLVKMRIIYKVVNPSIGQYEDAETIELANIKAKEVAWQFYLSQTSNSPISKVTINDDDSETWETV